MKQIVVLKGEMVYSRPITLEAHTNGQVEFRVRVDGVVQAYKFIDIDKAMQQYKCEKEEIIRSGFGLFEHLRYCRDNGMNPYETATYLSKQGYRKGGK